MERNMKLWAVLAIWLSFTVVFGLGRVIFPLPTHNYTLNQIPSVSFTLTYTEDDKANYQQFLAQLRTKLASGANSHGIPVLRAMALNEAKYLLVNIKNSDGKEITFGLSIINVYVLAYKVGDNSYFFNDQKELRDAQRYLFTNTRQVILTAFSGNYIDFERQNANRLETDIGIWLLNDYISALYSKTSAVEIAKPLVCIIQMVAEAARFKYIEKKITDKNVYESFKPQGDITSRENNWDPLSTGIQYADKDGYLQTVDKRGNLKRTTVTLYDKIVANVNQVNTEMGILLYAVPVKMTYNIMVTVRDHINFLLQPWL